MIVEKYICPLCSSYGEDFYSEEFQKCPECKSIFRCPEYFLSPEDEKSRYEEHNNDVYDIKYQNFVSPIVEAIQKNHANTEIGLDFWAGTGPVISHLLWKKWFQMYLYDPFFHNSPELLEKKYDFIIACEVIEHFHNPKQEFELLYKLLSPNGKLYLMTDIYSSEVDFWKWYYKNDPTHVFFYSIETFSRIQNMCAWKKWTLNKRLVILEK